MAKKSLAVLIVAVLAAGSVFAQEQEKPKKASGISAGGGLAFDSDFGGGIEVTGSAGGQSGFQKVETPHIGFGGYAFLDATYAELALTVTSGDITIKQSQTGRADSESSLTMMNMNIGLLGKYPFEISEKLVLFPLLGIDYAICMAVKNDSGTNSNSGDYSALWFKFGGGLDFALTQKLYLRFEALYGIRLASKAEKDMKDSYEAQFKNTPGVTIDDSKTLLGHGLTAKLGVGYKF
jgi:opacity protein-like surface antigen